MYPELEILLSRRGRTTYSATFRYRARIAPPRYSTKSGAYASIRRSSRWTLSSRSLRVMG